METSTALAHQIIRFINGDVSLPFEEQAFAIFRYQFEHNLPYRNFCRGRGVTPDRLRSWHDIPPAPAAAFKQFALSAAPVEDCQPERGGRVFHSSGTTGSETSSHYLDRPALAVYRASLRDGYRRFVLPDAVSLPIFALMPPATGTIGAPHSSLSFMLEELIADYGGQFFIENGWQAQLAERISVLTEPIVLFGTAFAFVHFFDAISEQFALPNGSRIVETGGFKGRSREIARDELYHLFTERFGVPATHCLSEYGMSEMASQFYDSTLFDFVHGIVRPPRKIARPTVRTRLIDPLTGQDALPGQAGLLAHYDIGNMNSVLALQTEDRGQRALDPVSGKETEGFLLLGRAPGAMLRGCSLTAEEWQTRF